MVTNELLSVVGIDVSKVSLDAAIVLNGRIKTHQFNNRSEGFTALLKWVKSLGAVRLHVCMEATGRYYEDFAKFLYSAGHLVSVVNPARIKGFGQAELLRNKTDKIDAGLIARFCISQNPEPWQPMPTEIREVQEVERYLGSLKAMKLQEKNRLGSGIKSSAVKKAIEKHIEQIDCEIAELEKWLTKYVKEHATLAKQVKLITSIPGVGLTTALVFLGEIGYGERFNFAGQIEAFAGLSTKRRQSGTSVNGQERLSKVGNANIRKALYMPAIVAMRHNPFMKSFAARLLTQGKKKMVVIGAIMRKLLRMILAVVKSGKPFDRNYTPISMHSVQSI